MKARYLMRGSHGLDPPVEQPQHQQRQHQHQHQQRHKPVSSAAWIHSSQEEGEEERAGEAAHWLSVMSLQGTISRKALSLLPTPPTLILCDAGRFKGTVLFLCTMMKGELSSSFQNCHVWLTSSYWCWIIFCYKTHNVLQKYIYIKWVLLWCFSRAVTKGITQLRIYNLLVLCTRWGQAPITAQRSHSHPRECQFGGG